MSTPPVFYKRTTLTGVLQKRRMSNLQTPPNSERISDFWGTFGELKLKKALQVSVAPFSAEREGFEPPDPLRSTVFKTAAFDHSAISPVLLPFVRDCKGTNKIETCKLFCDFLRYSVFFSEFRQKSATFIFPEALP